MTSKFLIVGAGFSGAVLANKLSQELDCAIDIWEERSHIAGNCFTERDVETGVMVHKYGPHIFNTDKIEIWNYVNSFITLRPFLHRTKAVSGGRIYSLPVNLHTINQFFNKTLSPAEAKHFISTLTDSSIDEPRNFEEQALKFIGHDLYKAFFYGYTKKQWGCEPTELPASILKRLPVRFNYEDSYYSNPFCGIPEEGYTVFVEKLLGPENIHVHLKKKFDSRQELSGYDHVFYTGPIDDFFQYKYGRLGYRTVTFESFIASGDHQGTPVINYCDENIPYTRITEHKHFTPWELHEKTICFKEFSKETSGTDTPYYPKRLAADKELLMRYRDDAMRLSKTSFLGRLATYRYMDMHHVIAEALSFATSFSHNSRSGKPLPVFPNTEA